MTDNSAWNILIKSSRFAVSLWGIRRLSSAFIFSRWFKLAHVYVQWRVTTLHKGEAFEGFNSSPYYLLEIYSYFATDLTLLWCTVYFHPRMHRSFWWFSTCLERLTPTRLPRCRNVLLCPNLKTILFVVLKTFSFVLLKTYVRVQSGEIALSKVKRSVLQSSDKAMNFRHERWCSALLGPTVRLWRC